MKGLLYYLLNRIWVGFCRAEYKRFIKSIGNVNKTQQAILSEIVQENCNTSFGNRYCFSQIKSCEEFQKRVPLTTYEDYQEYIYRLKAGEDMVLTDERVIMLELSSGSTSSSKLIPYTKGLKKQFNHGISPWVYDLYTQCKGLYNGRSYWSITPLVEKMERTKGGIPIGFEEDSQYFGSLSKYLLDYLFAVPAQIKFVQETEAFRYITLLFMLKEKQLVFISIWNPTFLILLMKALPQFLESLVMDLEEGTVTPPTPVKSELINVFIKKLGKNPIRARELREIFKQGKKPVYEMIWPNLRLISCWTNANAEVYIPQLKEIFPNVEIQGKGLLATEAFVTFPLYRENGAVLSIWSHFFEFEELDENMLITGNIKLAHELEKGRYYSVVVTTKGGLYRYRLQDIVEVTGFLVECPKLKFIGKGEKISDLCGEKLNDLHVKSVIEKELHRKNLATSFYMLAPEVEGEASGYVLFIEMNDQVLHQKEMEKVLSAFKNDVELGLRENFHYNYCRQLGQLQGLRLFIVDGQGIETYIRICGKHGQREGNIKPCALHNKTGWTKEFRGKFINANIKA